MWGWLCFILLWIPGSLIGQQWTVDSSHIAFKIKNAGVLVDGSFEGLDLQMIFDPYALENAQIKASIEASSVDTGIRIRDKHLCRSDYFNSADFPRITLVSLGFQQTGSNEYLGAFFLNLKGEQRQITFPFTCSLKDKQALLQGSFQIDRRDYHIGGNSIILEDKVTVEIWVKAHKK